MIKYFYKIGSKTWFGTGGKCFVFFEVESQSFLVNLMKFLPKKMPIFPIGLGSNILFRDGFYFGAVIKLGTTFAKIKYLNEDKLLKVGCSVKDLNLANFCYENSLTGFEFLIGIPGTIGGAIKMNSGCYNQCISDHLISISCINRKGKKINLLKKDIQFGYRTTNIPEDYIFIDATFKARKSSKHKIRNLMQSIKEERKKSQPLGVRTGGSTFKNPNNEKAWKLIDKAGFRGIEKNLVQVSNLHPNFIINHGNTKSLEIELLGEEIRKKVYDENGIKLDWEIERVGSFEKI